MKKIRILALDGGGTRASVLARTLGELYGGTLPGRRIIGEFDYVAGNSGGSIVLTALCCNYTPNEIASFYNDPAVLRRMFSPRWSARIPLLQYVLGRYSSKGKLEALKWIFDRRRGNGEPLPSDIRIHEWPTYLKHEVDLIVAAFDYDQERATFFRSNRKSLAKSSAPPLDVTLVEAVHASTNPPLPYYDKPAEFAGHRYWDGALAGYNNPVLAAIVEALANRPGEADGIRVLSIGTGGSAQPGASREAPPPIGKARAGTCVVTALKTAGTAIFADPPDVASFHAHLALRQPMPGQDGPPVHGHVVRLCPLVRPLWDPAGKTWTLPQELSAAEFEALIKMRLDPIEETELALIRKMTDLWIAGTIPNQPIRLGDHMRCDIGHEKFADAAAHWKAIA